MSGPPATNGAARVLLVDDGVVCDVFEVVEARDGMVRVRAPFMFEVGEELRVRVERDGKTTEQTARVRRHLSTGESELELVAE